MTRLEELTPGAMVHGLVPGEPVTIVALRWAGSASAVVTYRTGSGKVDEQVVYRQQEPALVLSFSGRPGAVGRRPISTFGA